MSATARGVAADALVAIEADDSYANLRLGAILDRSDLDGRDRRFVTELVYGSIRMRRALDFVIDPYLSKRPGPKGTALLRLGAYQLRYTDVPDHAAVAATVAEAPKRLRGLVNAVLRRVATTTVTWPDDATALSYPDWIVETLRADLGAEPALAALEAMNRPATVSERDDGYVQDPASQWVAESVHARPGEVVFDMCAAPGGKATAIAASGAHVIAADARASRVGLIADNAARIGSPALSLLVADGRRPPVRAGAVDRVLVDAPCSGLGVLRRRADARWRVRPSEVSRLARLQGELLDAALPLVAPGGVLTYSVCTLTAAETLEVVASFAERHGGLEPTAPLESPWVPWGSGSLLLPQAADTDGMFHASWRVGRRYPGPS